jgi:heterodisulfide reductase subunit C
MAGEMEYPPRKIIALIRAGMRDEVLSSSSMWHCLSCYLCTVRCPRGVKPTELAHALESLASQQRFPVKETHTPAMYRSFVGSIKDNGRVHEFGMILRYYLTRPLEALKMLPVGMQLFLHRRLSLLPHKVSAREDLARITEKFKEVKDRR